MWTMPQPVADLLRLRDKLRAAETLAEAHQHVVEVVAIGSAGWQQDALRGIELDHPFVGSEVFGHAVVVEPLDGLASRQTEQPAVGERCDVPVGRFVDVLAALVAADIPSVAGPPDVDPADVPGRRGVVVRET